MNKVQKIVGILIVVLTTLCSCTTDTIEQNTILKRIVEVSVDGTMTTTLLHYDGNKILNIDSQNALLQFYYTGNLITKKVELNKSTLHENTLEYFYSDGKLTQIKSSDNYVVNYIYAKDDSVSYEKLIKDVNNIDIRIYHGKLTFQNGNLLKDEKTLDDTGTGILTQMETNFVYDTKRNPLNTIVGFNKLLDFQEAVSLNNSIITTESTTIKITNDDQASSSIKREDSQYQYNSNGYPAEIVSEKMIFGDSNSKHLKSQLFYN